MLFSQWRQVINLPENMIVSVHGVTANQLIRTNTDFNGTETWEQLFPTSLHKEDKTSYKMSVVNILNNISMNPEPKSLDCVLSAP